MNQIEITLKEYEISKDSIKSVMAQLGAVSALLITVSVILVQLVFNGEQKEFTGDLLILVLISLNFLAAFTLYQNIQINALQMHIQSLEQKLGISDVFRWESRIARVWYSTDAFAIVLNAALLVPPLLIVVIIYAQLYFTLTLFSFIVILSINSAYIISISIAYVIVIKRVERIFNVDAGEQY